MTTKAFINTKREGLFKIFQQLEYVKYCFDRLTNAHYFLIPIDIYESKEFSKFDAIVTRESLEFSIQGIICFMTDETLFDFENQKTYYNPFNNNVLLKNLVSIVSPNDFFNLNFRIADAQASFNGVGDLSQIRIAGENNYAMAA